MSRIGNAIGAFIRTWKRTAPSPTEPREFVYLDETSVESLLASLDGEVLVGVTSTRGRNAEFGIGATGDTVGVPIGVSPNAKVGRSSTVQEERKSIAQSAFARLRTRQLPLMSIRAGEPVDNGIEVAGLQRGDLLELNVDLRGADVFRVQAVIQSMVEVVESYPDLLPDEQRAAVLAGEPIAKLLDSLSRGLIPIEGRVSGIRMVDQGGSLRLVHTGKNDQNGVEVHIGGVTLEPLYWQDVRRVLFSRSQFRVMVRLLHSGVRDSWNPVKISEILAEFSPQTAVTINSLGTTFLHTMLEAGENASMSQETIDARAGQLKSFARAHVDNAHGAVPLTEEVDIQINKLCAEIAAEDMSGAEYWRSALNRVADVIDESLGASVTEQRAHLRASFPEPVPSVSDTSADRESDVAFLEVEIIAIYW